jgi:hypothetical protein
MICRDSVCAWSMVKKAYTRHGAEEGTLTCLHRKATMHMIMKFAGNF